MSEQRTCIDYTKFFQLNCAKPRTNADCIAHCLSCKKSYKYVLTSKGNLLKHLETCHYREISRYREKLRLESGLEPGYPSKQFLPAERATKDAAFLNVFITQIVGNAGLGINVIQQPWFNVFVKTIAPEITLPSAETIENRINEITYEDITLLLKFVFSEERRITCTVLLFDTDSETDGMMACYLHYITSMKKTKKLLFFKSCVQSPRSMFIDQIQTYNIMPFASFCNDTSLWRMVARQSLFSDIDMNLLSQNFTSWSIEDECDHELLLQCNSLKLYLVVLSTWHSMKSSSEFNSMIAKCKFLIEFKIMANAISENLLDEQCKHGWNRDLALLSKLQHLIRNSSSPLYSNVGAPEVNVELNFEEFSLLDDIIICLTYIQDADRIIQGDSCSINKVIPFVDALETAILLHTCTSEIGAMFKSILLNELYEKFADTINSSLYLTATVLDPSVKLNFTDGIDLPAAKKFLFEKAMVRSNVFDFIMKQINFKGIISDKPAEIPTTNLETRNSLTCFLRTSQQQASVKVDAHGRSSVLQYEFDDYLANSMSNSYEVVQFWSSAFLYPNLKVFAIEILAIPASNTCTMSFLDTFENSKKSACNADSLEKSMILKSNFN